MIEEIGSSSFGTSGSFRRLFLPLKPVSNETFFVSKSKYPKVFNAIRSFVDVDAGVPLVPKCKPNDFDTLLATNDSFFCANMELTFETDGFLYVFAFDDAILVTIFGRYVTDDVILVLGLILRVEVLGELERCDALVVVIDDDGRLVWPYCC